MVSELLNDSRDGWHENRVKELYGDYLGDQICKIPVIHNGPNDKLIWFSNPNGSFTTKSGYSWLTLKHIGYGPHQVFWRLTWKLQTLPKIRIFCLRLGHEILPTNEKIASIQSDFDSSCPRCGLEKETLIHALKKFPMARAVLMHRGLNNNLFEGDYNRCCDWIEGAVQLLDKKALSYFITVLWNIWNGRNNRIFRGVEEEAKTTWERPASLSHDFRIFNLLENPVLPRKSEDKA
ncbi:uncharacterized protein [Gossypium hirsutum]|uniref:Reverse transcriptase zinc-binding domain-containing protein n=1 Tax=Gossypium hirsutum TaxID=3635 RepID=A0A1U8MK96_GOSHI|nr:uncharacterized protein LOC107937591 [Gossypium hirsutum]